MADYLRLDAALVKAEIGKLLAVYPELADDETLRLDTIEGETDALRVVERALAEKLDADAMAEAVKLRVNALSERAGRFTRKAEAMKALIRDILKAGGVQKLILTEATISLTKPRNYVKILDVNALGQGYFKTERIADKKALLAALERGDEIPGAELALGETGLAVRTK